ncbi:MAG: PilC/PilY family type IV pilus protein, partial [Lysobacterales bacterium]
GNRSKEKPGGPFRTRSQVLGDIINSRPVVAGPKDDYGHGVKIDTSAAATAFAASYRAYLVAKSTRATTVFIGANDGMLHAFDGRGAGGGAELFGFIPSSVVGKVGQLAKPAYVHQFYVDGELNIGDARLGSWKTVLVGSPGAGGKGVFALDVSSPATLAADNLLWELTSADNDNIGQSIGRVEIIRGEDNNWYAAFGNGFNSVNGNPTLMLVDLGTGLVVGQYEADDGGNFSNGLGQIVGLDLNFNGKADTIYGGDLRGNIWKFDLSGSSSASWGVAFGAGGATPLFTARDRNGNPQQVTGGFEVASGPDNGVLLYFGTGSYFLVGDNNVPPTPPVQTVYAVLDRNVAITGGRAALQEQRITAETAAATGSGVTSARDLTKNGVDYTTKNGFYLDLAVQAGGPVTGLGERFVGVPRVQSGKVFFTTFQPIGSACNPGGINFLYGLDAVTGAASLGSIRAGSAGNVVCGANCGGIALGAGNDAAAGPVRETVMIVPPRQCVRGVDPGCTAPPEPCVAGSPGCPSPVPLPSDNQLYTPCSVKIAAAGSPEFTLPRPCGRQSWRQVR